MSRKKTFFLVVRAALARCRRSRVVLATAVFAGLCTVAVPAAQANNLSISNVVLSDPAAGVANVTFDIRWENSWRDAVNHDAAWVFLKFSTDGGATWDHGTLFNSGTDPDGYLTGSGTAVEIVVPGDRGGAFIQRSTNGSGTTDVESVRVRWRYGADRVRGTTTVIMKVHGIEMVYIPEGSFYLGSGGSEDGRFYRADNTALPFNLTGEGALITASSGSGHLWGAGGTTGHNAVSPADPDTIPAEFPKGYAAFYCMKYEISQGQYRDFLNMLTRAQQAARCSATTAGRFMCDNNSATTPQNRNGIMATDPAGDPDPRVYVCNFNDDGSYNQEDDGIDLACNWLSWADVAAYADWAALRPMTEFEFEKACRGTASPVAGEYAWATASIVDIVSIVKDGYPEAVRDSPATANCNYNADDILGPVRCGFFAAGATGREMAGATYYGAMEMSGNVWERPVTIGNAEGRSFTGAHGDGTINAIGDADATDWPGTDAAGAGLRGGSWYHVTTNARVSRRVVAAYTYANRHYDNGGRCVRSAE
jgi:formylglycine-generating enzyme required for sulfatase activity